MIVIGIDPGKSGGIASINDELRIMVAKMPETSLDIYRLIDSLAGHDAIAVIEKVGATPQMGVVSAFKFGRSVGELHMACLASELRILYVTPQKWQKEFSLLSKARGIGKGDTAKKNRNKAKAQELFPGIAITHAIADALLIAEYGRRVLTK